MKNHLEITDNNPVDIHLILTYHWYDEIDAGRKWVEYREQSDYYKRMFLRNYKLLKRHGKKNTPFVYLYKNIRSVTFHRGYTSTTMRWHVTGITVAYGEPIKGAPCNRPVFCLFLGDRYKQSCKNQNTIKKGVRHVFNRKPCRYSRLD